MTPLEASSIFATLVGLICNWKQERSGVATDKFQDFLTWLTNHNFQALRAHITESSEVQHELHELLREDSAALAEKLDLVCTSLSALSDRIDGLAALSRALRAPADALSDQAAAVLQYFERSGDTQMIFFNSRRPAALGFVPSGRSISVGDTRFLDDDVTTLEAFGFIRVVRHNDSGQPIYALTRAGSRFAAQLPSAPPAADT